MTLNGSACIVGAYEHPTRKADGLSVLRLHADVAKGALADAGLAKSDIDGYFCAGDAPGLGTATVAEYLGLKLRHIDSTDCGGSAPILHVAHAAQAIAAGRCNVALITLAGRPRAAMAEAEARAVASGDPSDAPRIALNLFSHDDDLRVMRAAIRAARALYATAPMSELIDGEMLPGGALRSDAELDDAIRALGGITHHPVGTCAMGTGPDAVVDPQLRVHGIAGLRVADASVMPTIVGGNTNAATLMIGEKAADLIIDKAPPQASTRH